MTDKENQINEMVKIIDKDEFYGLAEKTPELIAEELYNAGYRKVDGKFCFKHSEKDYYLTEKDAKGEKTCEDCRNQVRKETAKEIFDEILYSCEKLGSVVNWKELVVTKAFLKEFASKYGVKING